MLNDLLDTFGYKIPEIFPAGYSDEAQAIFDAMPTEPNDARKTLINNLVVGLKDDGIWAKLDVLYLTAAHAQDSSLLNWINPGTHDCTIVNLVAGLFTIDRGWTGNGVNGYLNSNYNPNTDAVNYAQNSASAGIYVRTNDLTDGKAIFGNRDAAARTTFFIRTLTWQCRVNTSGVILGPVHGGDITGFAIETRTAVNSQTLYKNNALLLNNATLSTGISNNDFYILCYNNNGVAASFTLNQVSAAFAGGGMTAPNVTAFTNRLETFMDAIGAGVIP